MKSLGQIYTPEIISKKICEDYLVIGDFIYLEPSMGYGSFYFNILDMLLDKGYSVDNVVENMLYGVDIDNDNCDYVKNRLKSNYGYNTTNNSKIFNDDYLLLDFGVKFDFIVGNPPYVSYKNIMSTRMGKKNYIDFLVKKYGTNTVSDLYLYFYLKGLSELNTGGKHIFLCSDTWIMSNYGDRFKEELVNFNLSHIISSPYEQFFKEDTNAIFTIIEKNDNDKTKILYDGFNGDFITITKNELSILLKNNQRNLLLVYPFFIDQYKKFVENNEKHINNYLSIKKNKLNFKTIIEDKGDNLLFYQDQSRINKPALYKNNINTTELKYSVSNKYIDHIEYNNIYMSSMIDRLPLLFWVKNGGVIPTSKYYTISSDLPDSRLTYFLIINPITLLDMEVKMKESTKRSMRVGEKGFAKEVDIKILSNLITYDMDKISDNTIKLMTEYLDRHENTVEFNIENIFDRLDYKDVINHIHNDCNLPYNDSLFYSTLMLYRKRMRNIKYRNSK